MYYNYERDHCAYCTVGGLTAEQAEKFQSFLFKFLAPEFLTIEEFGVIRSADGEIEQDAYRVEFVFKVELDDEGGIPSWILGGLSKYPKEKLRFNADNQIYLFLLNNEDLKKLLPPPGEGDLFTEPVSMREIFEKVNSEPDLIADCLVNVSRFKDYGVDFVEEEHEIYAVEKLDSKTSE